MGGGGGGGGSDGFGVLFHKLNKMSTNRWILQQYSKYADGALMKFATKS